MTSQLSLVAPVARAPSFNRSLISGATAKRHNASASCPRVVRGDENPIGRRVHDILDTSDAACDHETSIGESARQNPALACAEIG